MSLKKHHLVIITAEMENAAQAVGIVQLDEIALQIAVAYRHVSIAVEKTWIIGSVLAVLMEILVEILVEIRVEGVVEGVVHLLVLGTPLVMEDPLAVVQVQGRMALLQVVQTHRNVQRIRIVLIT